MTTKEIDKAAEEYAESLKSIAFENLSGEETPYLLRGAFKEGLESANKYWQEKSVEMFNNQRLGCVHEWEPIWDNNSSLTSVKHRCLKCGEIQ